MRNSDIVYNQIKELIITAELKPGQVIVDTELMERFKIGRTPIREALNRLSWEGQIRIIPRQCIMVSELPLEDLESIFQIRYTMSILEGQLVAERRTEQEIEYLSNLIDVIKKEELPEKRVMLDRTFHRAISKITRNRFLETEMNNTLDLSVRLLFLNKSHIGSIDDTVIKEYEDILESIITQNGQRATELLQHHVTTFRNKFLK